MAVDSATSAGSARAATRESGDGSWSEPGLEEGLSAGQAAGVWLVLALATVLVAAPVLMAVALVLSPAAVLQAFP